MTASLLRPHRRDPGGASWSALLIAALIAWSLAGRLLRRRPLG